MSDTKDENMNENAPFWHYAAVFAMTAALCTAFTSMVLWVLKGEVAVLELIASSLVVTMVAIATTALVSATSRKNEAKRVRRTLQRITDGRVLTPEEKPSAFFQLAMGAQNIKLLRLEAEEATIATQMNTLRADLGRTIEDDPIYEMTDFIRDPFSVTGELLFRGW